AGCSFPELDLNIVWFVLDSLCSKSSFSKSEDAKCSETMLRKITTKQDQHMKIPNMMKTAVVTAFLAATTALAQQVTVSQIPGYHANDGEFNVVPVIGSGYDTSVVVNGGFETFCISRFAYLATLPGQYFATVDAD